MNKEYFSINDNFYGVLNENNKLNVILSNQDPNQCLNKQNELENLNLIKNNNIDKINKLEGKRKRKIFATMIYSALCITVCEYNILIYLNIILSIMALELLTKGSYRKINKEIESLNNKNIEINNLIEEKTKEVKKLEKELNYKSVNIYDYTTKNSNDKLKVKKLVLKKN